MPAESSGRRVLRVWDAYTGTWHTNWDPINSTTIQTCAWGAPRDIPLAGPIDRDANSKTDLVVFRPTQSPPTVYIKGGNLCLPGNSEYSFTVPGGTPRSVISAVPDMSGDARGDVLVFDPNSAGWTRYYSQSFAAQSVITFGNDGAMPL